MCSYWLSINQDIDSDLFVVTDTDRQEAISNLIQKLVKEKKDPDQTLTSESTMRKRLKKQFLLKRQANLSYHQ